jgi:hypothetical protein
MVAEVSDMPQTQVIGTCSFHSGSSNPKTSFRTTADVEGL